ncbi:MAG TPA: iron ABC transporter permease [Actinobacteria bacterium]|nr:iron ABC transporter permease [Actinomycetota bacterium]
MLLWFQSRKKLTIILLTALLFTTAIIAIASGPVSISPGLVFQSVLKKSLSSLGLNTINETPQFLRTIIFEIRIPRVILALLVGASLATSGVIFQALFKNPMADPYIIGVSAGGALGASVVLLLGFSFSFLGLSSVSIFAFIGSLLAAYTVYMIARVGGKVPVSSLLLSGIAIGSFLSAVMSFLMVLKGEGLHAIVFWLMGGLSAKGWAHVNMFYPFFIIGFFFAMLHVKDLNIILLGDERAAQLGVEVEKVKRKMLILGSLLAAAAVSVSGLIGFVGLMTPHIVRLIIGPDHKYLLPVSTLGGAIILLSADTVARVALAPSEIPLGIITALLGAPFFLMLLKGRRETFWERSAR